MIKLLLSFLVLLALSVQESMGAKLNRNAKLTNMHMNKPKCLYKKCNKWIIAIILDLTDDKNAQSNLRIVETFIKELADACFDAEVCDTQIWVQWSTPQLDDVNCDSNQIKLWQMQYNPKKTTNIPTNTIDPSAPPWKCNCSTTCTNIYNELNSSTIYEQHKQCSTFPVMEMIGVNYAASMYLTMGYGVALYYISDHYSEQLSKNANYLQNDSDSCCVNTFWLFIGVDQFAAYTEPYTGITRMYATPNGAMLNYRVLSNYSQLTPQLANELSSCGNTSASESLNTTMMKSCETLYSTTPIPKNLNITSTWFQNDSGPYALSVVLILATNNSASYRILNALKKRFLSSQKECDENSIKVDYLRFVIPGDFANTGNYSTSNWFNIKQDHKNLEEYVISELKPGRIEVPTVGYIEPYLDDHDNFTDILVENTLFQDKLPLIMKGNYQHLVLLLSDFISSSLTHRSYCIRLIEAVKGDQFAATVIGDVSALMTLFFTEYKGAFSRAKYMPLNTLETNPTPKCLLSGLLGTTDISSSTTQPTRSNDNNIGWLVALGCLSALIFFVFLTALICIYNKHRREMNDKIAWVQYESAEARKRRICTHPTTILQKVDAFEVSHERLNVYYDRQLGSGAFGTVFQGILLDDADESNHGLALNLRKTSNQQLKYTNCGQYVAIKMLPKHACIEAKAAFLHEISVSKELCSQTSAHVVQMLGCITVNEPLCLITEFCHNGDLLNLLKKRDFAYSQPLFNINDDSNCVLSPRQLLSFAWQVSDGMHYISSCGLVHCDLAARNVFVDSNLTAKVGDFGHCRSVDSEEDTWWFKFPIKWTAIESLEKHNFSTKSDVWSYAITVYEIFGMGRHTPYKDIKPNQLLKHLQSGKRLERPPYASEKVYKLMLDCWKTKPTSRPSFLQIRTRLSKIIDQAVEDYGYLRTASRTESVMSSASQSIVQTTRRLSVTTLQSSKNDADLLPILT